MDLHHIIVLGMGRIEMFLFVELVKDLVLIKTYIPSDFVEL